VPNPNTIAHADCADFADTILVIASNHLKKIFLRIMAIAFSTHLPAIFAGMKPRHTDS
jgi:hypothetical protein